MQMNTALTACNITVLPTTPLQELNSFKPRFTIRDELRKSSSYLRNLSMGVVLLDKDVPVGYFLSVIKETSRSSDCAL